MNKTVLKDKFHITGGHIIFSVIYAVLSLVLAFLIYRNGFLDKDVTYTDIVFTQEGNTFSSETMSFPAGNYMTTICAATPSPGRLVVYSGSDEVYSQDVLPSDEAYQIIIAYTLPVRTSAFRISFLGEPDEGYHVDYITFSADTRINNDARAKAVCVLMVLLFFYILIMLFSFKIINREQLLSILILFIFSLYVSSPLMTDHLIYGHDLRCHTGRIDGIRNAFMDGQTVPMIIPDIFNGFGILTFEYPWLFLLIPVFLRFDEVSMVLAYGIFLTLINIATAFVCFYSVKSVLKHLCKESEKSRIVPVSLVSALFYTLSTYRLCDVYIRAAMGEMLAMIFLPLLLAGLYHICTGEKHKWYLLLIALTGIMQSHILSCVLIIPLCIIIMLPFIKQILSEKRWVQLLLAAGSFLLINLWYIIPFIKFLLLPLNTDEFTQYWVINNIVHLKNLFLSAVHTGFADDDRFTPSLGLCALVCIIFIILYVRDALKENSLSVNRLFLSCASGTLIFIVISSDLIPWNFLEAHFPHLWKCIHMIQFPYRFLTLAMVCIVYALSISLIRCKITSHHILPAMLLILTFSLFDAGTLTDIYTNCGWVTFKTYSGGFVSYTPKDYLPAGINTDTFMDASPLISSGEITEYDKKGTSITFTYASGEDAVATMPLNYYPCYEAVLETGDKLSLSAWEDKRMLLVLPAGVHTVTIKVVYPLF